MAEAFQAAVDLGGNPAAFQIVKTVHDILDGPAPFRDVQVLVGDHLGDGEAVVEFHHADLLAGVFYPGFPIGPQAAFVRGHKVIAVPVVEAHFFAVAQGQLQGLDGDEILPAHLPGLFHRGYNGASGTVADAAAIEQTQGMSDDRGGHDLVLRDRFSQVGLGVQGAVGVTFDGDMGQGPF